jgi:hypothetical protein
VAATWNYERKSAEKQGVKTSFLKQVQRLLGKIGYGCGMAQGCALDCGNNINSLGDFFRNKRL